MKRIIVICLLCALLAACQPTPEQEFVTHKDTDEMLAKAAEPVEDAVSFSGGTEEGRKLPEAPHIRARYAIPERLKETVTEADGHFVVDIDAPVEVPDVAAIPIIRVERGTFTQDEVTRLFNALTKGRTLYHDSRQMTKSQIAEAVARLENELNDPNSKLEPDDRESYAESIANLKELFKTAPDELSEDVCDGTIVALPTKINDEITVIRRGFHGISRDDGPTMYCYFEIGGDDPRENLTEANFWFSDDRSLLQGSDGDIKIRIQDPKDPVELTDYPNVTYMPEDAMADTEAFFRDAGFPFVRADSLTFFPSKDGSRYGYQVKCVRETADVKVMNGGFETGSFEDGFAKAWQYEDIEVCIDEQGVYAFHWRAPLKVTETVLGATNLLPYGEIVEKMRRQLWIEKQPWLTLDENAVMEEDFPSDLKIEVFRVTLTLQRVMEKNKFDSGLLVPVWNFWGTISETRVNKKTRAIYVDFRDARDPLVSINAIDGSIIDPWKGY
jgi:hypothetical protein